MLDKNLFRKKIRQIKFISKKIVYSTKKKSTSIQILLHKLLLIKKLSQIYFYFYFQTTKTYIEHHHIE